MANFLGYNFNDFPKIVHLETTNTCTSKCVFCPVSSFREKEQPLSIMPFELCSTIIEQFPSSAVERVSPFINNEPLLYRDLIPLMRLVKLKSPTTKISIYTNASLLTKQMSFDILESGLDYIHFSMGGITKLTYEKVYVGLAFESVMANIIRFVKMSRSYDVKTSVALSMTGQNCHELERFKEFWHCHKIHDVNGVWVTSRNRDAYNKKIYTTERKPQVENAPCLSALFDHMWIYGNGDVGFCCEDAFKTEIVGNVYQQTIPEIWLGDKLNRLRKFHLEGNRSMISICNGCNHTY